MTREGEESAAIRTTMEVLDGDNFQGKNYSSTAKKTRPKLSSPLSIGSNSKKKYDHKYLELLITQAYSYQLIFNVARCLQQVRHNDHSVHWKHW
jgi:hypothetical protein